MIFYSPQFLHTTRTVSRVTIIILDSVDQIMLLSVQTNKITVTIWNLILSNIRTTGYIRGTILALRQEHSRLNKADSSSTIYIALLGGSMLSLNSNSIDTQTQISIHPPFPSPIYSPQSSLSLSPRTMAISASTGDVKDPTSTTAPPPPPHHWANGSISSRRHLNKEGQVIRGKAQARAQQVIETNLS